MPDSALARPLTATRRHSLALAAPLSPEVAQAQSMPDASPAKWHLAHTTWFFETLVLERFAPGFRPFDAAFRVLFNSYYQGVGAQHPRAQRGLLTRPSLAEVLRYRAHVDEQLHALLRDGLPVEAARLVEQGIQHEQQHQELLLTDALHLLASNPLAPVYDAAAPLLPPATTGAGWVAAEGGLVEIGHHGSDTGFAFDNESPRHRRWLDPFELAARLVSNADWQDFIDAGAYSEPRWWLSAGWDWVRANGIGAPLYWQCEADADGSRRSTWSGFSLRGRTRLEPDAPVCHVSLYEAEAYARWAAANLASAAGARLPTEAEWEHAAEQGQAIERRLWQWTRSAYEPYPGYRPWVGAVGEYNGKFMADQWVLRGGSWATPAGHLRSSYRNFFPATMRWQFCGLRLARDAR